jgi:hypothetical protein
MPLTLPIFPSRAINLCSSREAHIPSPYDAGFDHARLYIANAMRSPNFRFTRSSDLEPPAVPSVISALRCSNSSGMSILTGQTSRHAPQRLEAYGSWLALFNPTYCGVRTAPIGPG